MTQTAAIAQPQPLVVNYDVSSAATLARFINDPHFITAIRGPRGSGKSTACGMRIMKLAKEQEPGADGISRTRWVVVRNHYRELEDTTLKTWFKWFPENYFGRFNQRRMSHRIILSPNYDIEVLFRALDRPKDVQKVLSLEVTGAWVNEARELPKGLIDGLTDAVGRFPLGLDAGTDPESKPTWEGLFMDTNSPDTDHWWYDLSEVNPPDPRIWKFYNQPGGLMVDGDGFVPNPDAENIKNLPNNYYLTRAAGKNRDHIMVYYCNEYGFVRDGKPIYPEYVDSTHCWKERLEPDPRLPLLVGVDFGLTPAALLGQQLASGRIVWIDELVTEDMGATEFGPLLKAKIASEYPDYEVFAWGDPTGDVRSQTDKDAPINILRQCGIPIDPAPSNDPIVRREAVAAALNRLVDGVPGLIISPKCELTRKGMAGGYAYKRVQASGAERYHDKPDKNRYSHVCEAGQYMMLGLGEGVRITRGSYDEEPDDYYEEEHVGRSDISGY